MGRDALTSRLLFYQERRENQLEPNKCFDQFTQGLRAGLNSDAVQMSAVLRHVAKYRQHWRVDFQAEPGRHVVGRGIVDNTFAYGEPYPSPHYDAEVQILLYDTLAGWTDRPNTRVSQCLHDRFGLPWDAALGRYQVEVSHDARHRATEYLFQRTGGCRTVAIHTQGDTAKHLKDLTDAQAMGICRTVRDLKRVPLVLGCMSGDAEVNCAVISQCEAFVGIDSGPSKCASATETPTLVVWTKHHPAKFHDPAPNTTHLVPLDFNDFETVRGDAGIMTWFKAHYKVMGYQNDPVPVIEKWLKEILR